MMEILLSIPVALLILMGCLEAGRLVLKIFRFQEIFESLASTIIKLAVGLVAVELAITALSFAHLLNPPALWVLFVALLISSLTLGRRDLCASCTSIADTVRSFFASPLNSVLASIILVALAMDLIVTFTPTTAWDALTAHYAIPFQWLKAGGFVPLPEFTFHELPAATEMLFASAFGLGGIGPDRAGAGVLAANHLTWAAGVFIVLSLVAIGKCSRRQNQPGKQSPCCVRFKYSRTHCVDRLSQPPHYLCRAHGRRLCR